MSKNFNTGSYLAATDGTKHKFTRLTITAPVRADFCLSSRQEILFARHRGQRGYFGARLRKPAQNSRILRLRNFARRGPSGFGFSPWIHESCSFNFITPVPSFEKNYWLGYSTRTVQKEPTGDRVTRLVYEHLGQNQSAIFSTARDAGFCEADDLVPYHKTWLKAEDVFS